MAHSAFLILMMVIITPSLSVFQQVQHDDRPIVTTDSGQIRGYTMNSRSGREYYAFTKIPYAKPPVAELRFKNAEPVDNWDGVLDANQAMPNCWQIPIFDPLDRNQTFGDEDCLYLSVFSPKVSDVKLPVLMYIHGGGWRSELPADGPNRASFFMDEDVILVSFHYRLGILGFMSLEDSVLPGNNGLKDQSLAIKWVSNNIHLFGGDPSKITIFGNSAGGASTHYHLISPMSKDLLQGGISQSGVATCLWALSAPGVAAERGHRVAEHLSCPTESSEEIIKCLQTKSAKDITDAERIFVERDYDPPVAFPPVIEKGIENAFLPDSPYNMVVEKPWIIGLTAADGAFKIPGYRVYPEWMDSYNENSVDILPEALMFSNTSTDPTKVSKEILKFYGNENPTKSLTEIFTDGFFTYCVDQALKKAKGPAYLYLFDYKGKTSFSDLLGKRAGIDFSDLGVAHTAELLYLLNFGNIVEDGEFYSEEDAQVSKRIVNTWAKFAKDNTLVESDWPQYNQEDKKYLDISNENSIKSKLWPERINFWNELNIRDKMEKNHV